MKLIKNNFSILLLICIFNLFCDYFFFIDTSSPPGWDQGYHLSNLFKAYNILNETEFGFLEKFHNLLDITDNYRGPLTYILSAFVLSIFKTNSYIFSYLSNNVYSIISILSIYFLGKFIKDGKTGLLAAFIFSFSPFIINQRTDYLIDLPLTCFYTLNILFLTKWFYDSNKLSINSLISGIITSFLILIRPTSLIILIFPITILFIKRKNITKTKILISEIIIFSLSIILIFFPWFSRHWITIISSIINAWQWGIKYQEGLDMNSIGGWFYYFQKIPFIIGPLNFGVISVSILFSIFKYKKIKLIDKKNIKPIDIWLSSFFINNYIVLSLMSTKDPRFFLPIYPLFCIYISRLLNNFIDNNNSLFKIRNFIFVSFFISIFLYNSFTKNSFKVFREDEFLNDWHHGEIIKEISNSNKHSISTLGFIPDTKEINTFNFEAEAVRQNEKVSVRQIISNEESYKDDLKYFDWFLIKDKDQGIMTNKSKSLLQEYLTKNNSFVIQKKWLLPDKSIVSLYKRKNLNSNIFMNKCSLNDSTVDIKAIKNGINIKLKSKGEIIKGSNLLINIIGNNEKSFLNISIANGLFSKDFEDKACYLVSQNIPVKNIYEVLSSNKSINAQILNEGGYISNVRSNIKQNISRKGIDNENILFENKIDKVKLLGKDLREGNFEKLFNLVGILNQSDPTQVYLKNAEIIYSYRYKKDKIIEDIYGVLISQILQRKIYEANETINKILMVDSNNGNAYFIKTIINIYLLNSDKAEKALKISKQLPKSEETNNIIYIADGIINLMNLNLIKVFKIFA